MAYLPTIGLEIHVELNTKTKVFCRCINNHFAKDPNIYICPVCLGLPGALPFPNKKAVISTVMLGKALNCQIAKLSQWDRKSYFYPDLPKGYQISQYEMPLCRAGYLLIPDVDCKTDNIKSKIKNQKSKTQSKNKKVRIRRIHLEEDTGKLIHVGGFSLIDYNRSGVPLVELVTEPDIEGPSEAKLFGQELQKIVRHLEISEANMEKGEMRVEANVSLASTNPKSKIPKLGTKVEIKNLNSFRSVERAIEYEIKRQREILEGGGELTQETRGWNEQKGETYSQRVKESESDYRYFPEPDIPPIQLSGLQDLSELKNPKTIDQKRHRYIELYRISQVEAEVLLTDPRRYSVFEDIVGHDETQSINYKELAKLLVNRPDILNRSGEEIIKISELSSHDQKRVIDQGVGLEQIDVKKETDDLQKTVKDVLLANHKAVQDFKNGKQPALSFLIGQVARKNPDLNPLEIKDVIADLIK